MTDTCCATTATASRAQLCPVSAGEGPPVAWRTVAALTRGALPPRQTFWLCTDPHCDVVYFGSEGVLLRRQDLVVDPGFKAGSDGLVCYCFDYRRSDLAGERSQGGPTTFLQEIKSQVRAGNCACEVKNPSGKCCLAEVQRILKNGGT